MWHARTRTRGITLTLLAAMVPYPAWAERDDRASSQTTHNRESNLRSEMAQLQALCRGAARPFGQTDRAVVERELIALLDAPEPPLRRFAFRWLSTLGRQPAALALGDCLSNPKRRRAALRALTCVPDETATHVLIDAMARADTGFRIALIQALGVRQSPLAVRVLTDALESPTADVALAALEALAQIGETPARPFEAAAIRELAQANRQRLTHAFLLWADRRAEAGDMQQAREIYTRVLRSAEKEHTRCAAIAGLAALRPPAIREVVAQLDDWSDDVRSAAHQALIDLHAENNARLWVEYANATPAVRAALLRVLSRRNAPYVRQRLREAAADSNVEVRLAALEMLGRLDEPALEPLLLEAAEWGSPETRRVALAAYLKLADRKRRDDSPAASLAMYHRALDLGVSPDLRIEALRGMAALGRPESINRVRRAMDNERTAEAAAFAYIEIAAALAEKSQRQREDAVRMIREALRRHGSTPVMDRAQRYLRSLQDTTTDP